MPRTILHLDMDAFYAAIEVREDPRLAGKALIIGHRGRRGVVSTCSYEARRFGVRSAMPSVVAERLCPHATWLPGRMSLYAQVSREIRAILQDTTPRIEPLSIDEAFLDWTGIAPDPPGALPQARQLQRRIVREQRLTCSIGVAPNKFLAKIASDLEKPSGLVLLDRPQLATRFHPLPLSRLWGVGPATAARLRAIGLERIGDLLRAAPDRLAEAVGPTHAAHLRALAEGRAARPVVTERQAKSVSEERTYDEDLTDPDEIDRAMLARAEGVARQLRRDGLVAHTVHLKVRTGDFTTWTRSLTLPEPTDLAEPLVEAARRLYAERIRLAGRGVRLLGVGASGLEPKGSGQGSLFEDERALRARKLARAADAVRDRLGEGSVTRARLLRRRRREASSLPTVD